MQQRMKKHQTINTSDVFLLQFYLINFMNDTVFYCSVYFLAS